MVRKKEIKPRDLNESFNNNATKAERDYREKLFSYVMKLTINVDKLQKRLSKLVEFRWESYI